MVVKKIKAPRGAKTAKSAKKGKAARQQDAKKPDTEECPRGGSHEWTEERGDRFCAKCKEPAPTKARKKAKAPRAAKPKKLSAIDAAAQVLATARGAMSCKELIEAMAAKGLWTSPAGLTPHATLYSALLREINSKGRDARFKKTERGRFSSTKAET